MLFTSLHCPIHVISIQLGDAAAAELEPIIADTDGVSLNTNTMAAVAGLVHAVTGTSDMPHVHDDTNADLSSDEDVLDEESDVESDSAEGQNSTDIDTAAAHAHGARAPSVKHT